MGLYTSCLYSPQQVFTTLKLLGVLLKHRRTNTQRYFLPRAPDQAGGCSRGVGWPMGGNFQWSVSGLRGWLDVGVCRKSWFPGVVNHEESGHPKAPRVPGCLRETVQHNRVRRKHRKSRAEPALTCVDTLLDSTARTRWVVISHIFASPHPFRRITSARALSQPPSPPVFNPPRSCLLKSPHPNNSLSSSGMNFRRPIHFS